MLGRFLGVLLVGLFLGWFVVGHGFAIRVRATSPSLATRLAPWQGGAWASAADLQLVAIGTDRATPAEIARASDAARRAIALDPLSPVAWRVLGYMADISGDQARARGLMHIAERHSRRDTLTHLWLIEDAVRREDVATAMSHYDVAMRTSRSSRDLLLPILVRATDDTVIRLNVARTLAANPPWRDDFITRFAAEAPSGAVAADLLPRLAGTGPVRIGPEMGLLLRRLVDSGDVAPARTIYEALSRNATAALPVRNGGFDRENVLPPFDWALVQDGAASASQADGRLEIVAASDAGGRVASQLLNLAPGAWRLQLTAGADPAVPAATLEITLDCGEPAARQFASATIRPTERPVTLPVRLDVPSDCPNQTLAIAVRSETQPGGSAAWIDDVVAARAHLSASGRRRAQ